jgi:hypothetical protein
VADRDHEAVRSFTTCSRCSFSSLSFFSRRCM